MSTRRPRLKDIPVSVCRPHEANRAIRDEDVAELADSIRAVGLLNPILVRQCGEGFQIIAGERRWRAHRVVEAETIAAFVYDDCEDVAADALRVVENEQRSEPTALDTARELRRIKNLHGLSHEGVAEKTGIPVNRVKRYLAIFQASDGLLDAIEQHRLPTKTALALTRHEKEHGEARTRPVLRRVVAGELTSRDVDALRKRKPRTSKSSSHPANPWERVEARALALIGKDPEAARAGVARISKALRDALSKRKVDAA